MKKILLVGAILVGAVTASRAGIHVDLGIGLPLPPLPSVVIGQPRAYAPVAYPSRIVAPCPPPVAYCPPPRVVYSYPSYRHGHGHYYRHGHSHGHGHYSGGHYGRGHSHGHRR